MFKRLKHSLSLIVLVAIIGLMSSCGKKMQDYPNFTVEETSQDGSLAVFKTENGLYGVANADGGDVIVEPQYGHIKLCGKFIVANMSQEEYDKIVKKLLDDAGINEHSTTKEFAEKAEKIKEHDFIRMGYDGRRYKRLYNVQGKLLKDYAFDPYTPWVDAMGDTIVWKTKQNNKPERDAHQLVSISGETTDIESESFSPTNFSYTIDGVLYLKSKGMPTISLLGTNMSQVGKLYITHDKGANLKFLRVYNSDGKSVDFGEWTPNRWTEGPSGKGIFVELLSGSPDSNDNWRAREQNIIYVDENGMPTSLPQGYSISKPSGDREARLIMPNGRESHKYYWND